MTRDEFERRYVASANLKKAELLEGVVYVPSPTRFEGHGEQHSQLVTWMGYYSAFTPGARSGDNSTIRLDLDNENGGQATINQGYIEGAAELAAEVAASSVSIDLHTKFHVYRRNQVQEYLVWRVLDQQIDWFHLSAGSYERLVADADSILRSVVFPGLWLDAAALVRGDMKRVLETLGRGVGSAEHQAFVAKLGI